MKKQITKHTTPTEEQGKLVIFSAPSGAGKSTIVRHLLKCFPKLKFSISACSRDPRGNEVDGKEYYFLGVEYFTYMINEDAFVEWEEVYQNNFYGTLKSELNHIWNNGNTAIFDMDVVGGLKLKQQFGDRALSIFVSAPSIEVLESRLRSRGTESEDKLQMRLSKVKEELTYAFKFDIILENDVLDDALHNAESIIEEFLSK